MLRICNILSYVQIHVQNISHLYRQNATFKRKFCDRQYMSQTDPRYINLRVPKTEYEKIKQVKEQLSSNPKYSWAESLALGAVIGLLAGMVIDELSKK